MHDAPVAERRNCQGGDIAAERIAIQRYHEEAARASEEIGGICAALLLGDISGHDESNPAVTDGERAGTKLDVDARSVAPSMLDDGMQLVSRPECRFQTPEASARRLRTEVTCRHTEELIASVAVLRDGRVIHGKEMHGFDFEGHHGPRGGVE